VPCVELICLIKTPPNVPLSSWLSLSLSLSRARARARSLCRQRAYQTHITGGLKIDAGSLHEKLKCRGMPKHRCPENMSESEMRARARGGEEQERELCVSAASRPGSLCPCLPACLPDYRTISLSAIPSFSLPSESCKPVRRSDSSLIGRCQISLGIKEHLQHVGMSAFCGQMSRCFLKLFLKVQHTVSQK